MYTLKKDFPTDAIDVDSEEYCFEYCIAEKTEKESYEAVTYPPVMYNEKGLYKPLLGRHILKRYASLKKHIPWALVIQSSVSPQDAVRYSIHLKVQMGKFSVVEKALALRRLYRMHDKVDDSLLRLLDMPENDRILRYYLKLADAPVYIKDMVTRGVMHENTAFEILSMESDSWVPVARFIGEIALGTRKRNEILRMLRDIARRDRIKVLDIIENAHVKGILHDTGIDPLHRGMKLYRSIRNMRYPSIHEYEEQFEKKLGDVHLDRKFHLILPENFEKWEFKLVIPFSSAKEFRQNVEALKKTGEQPSFEELMSLRY